MSNVAGVVGGSCCRWQLSGCQLSRWQFAQVAVVLGGRFPGGNCPRTDDNISFYVMHVLKQH